MKEDRRTYPDFYIRVAQLYKKHAPWFNPVQPSVLGGKHKHMVENEIGSCVFLLEERGLRDQGL